MADDPHITWMNQELQKSLGAVIQSNEKPYPLPAPGATKGESSDGHAKKKKTFSFKLLQSAPPSIPTPQPQVVKKADKETTAPKPKFLDLEAKGSSGEDEEDEDSMAGFIASEDEEGDKYLNKMARSKHFQGESDEDEESDEDNSEVAKEEADLVFGKVGYGRADMVKPSKKYMVLGEEVSESSAEDVSESSSFAAVQAAEGEEDESSSDSQPSFEDSDDSGGTNKPKPRKRLRNLKVNPNELKDIEVGTVRTIVTHPTSRPRETKSSQKAAPVTLDLVRSEHESEESTMAPPAKSEDADDDEVSTTAPSLDNQQILGLIKKELAALLKREASVLTPEEIPVEKHWGFQLLFPQVRTNALVEQQIAKNQQVAMDSGQKMAMNNAASRTSNENVQAERDALSILSHERIMLQLFTASETL